MHFGTTLQRASLLIFSILLTASTLAAAQAGQLDPTFGQGGIVTTDFGTQLNATATAVKIQVDAKIVVFGGVSSSNGSDVAVARYNTDGSLDTGFGTAGIATVAGLDFPSAMTLQPDGKIVGVAFNIGGYAGSAGITVVRFSSNGSLDSTFGTGGVVTTGILNFGQISGVVIQKDGNILIADGELLRLLPNGQFDSSFGNGGQAGVLGGNDGTPALALLPNGKILVSSASLLPASGYLPTSSFVSRYNSNGSLDTNFAISGMFGTTGPANALLLLSNGEFLVGGNLTHSPTGFGTLNTPIGFAVSRYEAAGTTDAKFGSHGGVVTPFANFSSIVTSGLGVQSSGDIVILGTASAPKTPPVFALARYTAAGQLDPTFGSNGTVTTSLGTTALAANGVAIQSDGNIVAFGSFGTAKSQSQNDVGFKLARYLGQ
jgi:uncharacterized delta-60 repeat protein